LLGRLASIFEGDSLRPQLLEVYQPFGGHFLITGAFAARFGDSL
jgi:hypothetical protein